MGQWACFVNQTCVGVFETRDEAANVGYRAATDTGRRAVFTTQVGATDEAEEKLRHT